MELVLLPSETLPSQIIRGPRVAPGVGDLVHQGQVQQVLTAIVKATFAAADASSAPLPGDQQQPLFERDLFFEIDPDETMRYEHDLAVFKPRLDVVVLGAPAPPEPGPVGGIWTERVLLGGALMQSTFSGNGPTTFGWETRLEGDREAYAGLAGSFDPTTMQLPTSFNNLFFNGGAYQGTGQPRFNHPPAGALISVETTALYADGGTTETRTRTRGLHLPAVGPTATITYRTGPARDAPTVSEPLEMRVDTVVYDKASGRFYAVWRGVWDYATVPAERYVSLVISWPEQVS